MEFSPLVQLLIVAVLAYGAGLLLGLSFYRGEIGPNQRGRRGIRPAAPVAAPPPLTTGDKVRRRRRRVRQFQEQLGDRVRQGLALAFLLALITMGCLGVYGVMRMGAQMVAAPSSPHHAR